MKEQGESLYWKAWRPGKFVVVVWKTAPRARPSAFYPIFSHDFHKVVASNGKHFGGFSHRAHCRNQVTYPTKWSSYQCLLSQYLSSIRFGIWNFCGPAGVLGRRLSPCWSRMSNENPKTVDWKRVALDCIEKDGFCEHPECGNTRLETNGEFSPVYMEWEPIHLEWFGWLRRSRWMFPVGMVLSYWIRIITKVTTRSTHWLIILVLLLGRICFFLWWKRRMHTFGMAKVRRPLRARTSFCGIIPLPVVALRSFLWSKTMHRSPPGPFNLYIELIVVDLNPQRW